MKLWIKLLLGALVGGLVGYFVSPSTGEQIYSFAADVVIHIGRYIIFPLVFFSLAIGTHELRNDKKVFSVYLRGVLYIIIISFITVIIGMISVIFFAPGRIPIFIEKEIEFTIPQFTDLALQLFPENAFQVLMGNPGFMLPLLIFAFLLGLNFSFDRLVTRPAVQFFDSMSRIFYHINSFILEIMGIGIIALSAFSLYQLRNVSEFSLYRQLLILFTLDLGILIFGVFPFLLYLFCGKKNPYKWLYAVIAPVIIGFFSGDSFFSLTALTRCSKENLGIPRKVGVSLLPLYSIFCKAGTAMITGISFFIILRSYSSLGLTISGILWIMGASLIISLITGTIPGAGPLISLSILCSLYGNGIEEGYLILKPIVPLLVSFGVVIDVTTSAFTCLLVSKHSGLNEEVEVKEFI